MSQEMEIDPPKPNILEVLLEQKVSIHNVMDMIMTGDIPLQPSITDVLEGLAEHNLEECLNLCSSYLVTKLGQSWSYSTIELVSWLVTKLENYPKQEECISQYTSLYTSLRRPLLKLVCVTSPHMAASVCRIFSLHPGLLPHTEADLSNLCISVVTLLATFPVPSDLSPDLMSGFQQEVKEVSNLLPLVWDRLPVLVHEVVTHLHSLLSSPTRKISFTLVSAVLELPWDKLTGLMGEDVIDVRNSLPVLSTLVTWLSCWREDDISRIVLHLMDYLLQEGKLDLLHMLATSQGENMLLVMMEPYYRDQILPVFLYFLYGAQRDSRVMSGLLTALQFVLESLLQETGELAKTLLDTLLEAAVFYRTLFPSLVFPHNIREYLPETPTTDRWIILASKAWFDGIKPLAVGLINLGNSCYLNSIIQALFHTTMFKDLILTARPTDNQPLLSSLQKVFHCLHQKTITTLSPKDFLHVSRPAWFVEGEQQDCSEFLAYLLNTLHEESSPHSHNDKPNMAGDGGDPLSISVVKEVFGGRLETSHKCLDCGTVSSSTDWFTDLHIPVMEEQESFSNSAISLPNLAHLPGISISVCREPVAQVIPHLADMVADYMAPELMSGENKYQCDVCCSLKDAMKTVRVVTAPSVLLLVLLRFKYLRESRSKEKVMTLVEYPEILVLEVEGSEVMYRLQSVVVHTGGDSQGGHYYTWTRGKQSKVWLLLNDGVVRERDWETFTEAKKEHKLKTPYLLFYERCTEDEGSPMDPV